MHTYTHVDNSPRSPNFDSIPTTELLSSAPTRSAFLQSLQRSREREERREQDIQMERDRERNGGYPEYYSNYEYKPPSTGNTVGSSNDDIEYKDYKGGSDSTTSSTPIMSRRRLSSSPSGSSSKPASKQNYYSSEKS